MSTQKHKVLAMLIRFIAEERGFTVEVEPETVEGVVPDLKLVHENYYPIHVRIQSKGDLYSLKMEKSKKAKAELMFINGMDYNLDATPFSTVLRKLEWGFEQCIREAEAPVGHLKFTKKRKWMKDITYSGLYDSIRREHLYRFYHANIGKLFWIDLLVNKEWANIGIVRLDDVRKITVDSLVGESVEEYNDSVKNLMNEKEKDRLCRVFFNFEEILKEE